MMVKVEHAFFPLNVLPNGDKLCLLVAVAELDVEALLRA